MKENKIILFANVKGGVGKSSLCGMFATFLLMHGESCLIVDADSQSSLYRHRQRDLKDFPKEKPLYPILSRKELSNTDDALKKLKQVKGWVLIDTPGNLVDDKLISIFKAADFIVVPTHFDADSTDATTFFVNTFRQISNAPMIFVPNRIKFDRGKNQVHDKEWNNAKKTLAPFGNMTARIKDSVAVERYSTVQLLESWQVNSVKYAFESVINEVNRVL